MSTGPAPTTPQQAATAAIGLAHSLYVSGAIDAGLANDVRGGVLNALEHADEPDEINSILHDLQTKVSDAAATEPRRPTPPRSSPRRSIR